MPANPPMEVMQLLPGMMQHLSTSSSIAGVEYSLAQCTDLQVILQSSLLLPQGGSHVSEVLQRGVLEAEGNLI